MGDLKEVNKEIITSPSNPHVKRLSALLKKGRLRREEGVFVCEGRKMFLEVLFQFPERIETAYFTEKVYNELNESCRERLSEISCLLMSDSLFDKAAETVTPQGVLAIVKFPGRSLEDLCLKQENGSVLRLLILDNLRDPGNLGTVVRTAEAAGMTGILLSSESVDVTNPKVVRSTMGAILRVPVCCTDSISEAVGFYRRKFADLKVYASALDASIPYTQADFTGDFAIIVGNESAGVSRESVEAADCCLHIPMEGRVESLNAAVAAAVMMYRAKEMRK